MKALILRIVLFAATYFIVSQFGFGLIMALVIFLILNVIAALVRGGKRIGQKIAG